MNFKGSESEYGLITQGIHWISMLLIFLMIPIGLVMVRISNGDLQLLLFKIHIFIGLTVLLLTLIRLIWAFIDIRPHTVEMSKEHYLFYKAVQILMYFVILLVALSGLNILVSSNLLGLLFGTINAIPFDIHKFSVSRVHNALVDVLMVLLGVHILGVLFYQFTKSNILARMGIKIKFFENYYNKSD